MLGHLATGDINFSITARDPEDVVLDPEVPPFTGLPVRFGVRQHLVKRRGLKRNSIYYRGEWRELPWTYDGPMGVARENSNVRG